MGTTTADKAKEQDSEAKVDAVESDESAEKFIAFKGHNGVRVISKEDWEAIGVKDQETSTWDKTNGWRIPSEEFNKRALNYLLKVDGQFVSED